MIDIGSLQILKGSLPEPKRRAVVAWAESRKDALTATFARAISKQRLERLP